MGFARLYAVGRWCDDACRHGFDVVFLFFNNLKLDFFAGKCVPEKNNLSVRCPAEALSAEYEFVDGDGLFFIHRYG